MSILNGNNIGSSILRLKGSTAKYAVKDKLRVACLMSSQITPQTRSFGAREKLKIAHVESPIDFK